MKQEKLKALSLFSNIGVAEAYLHDTKIEVVIANELIKKRAELYSQIYPNTKMICGDITDKNVIDTIIKNSLREKVDIVMATPPCQGMSTAGKQLKDDERNKLICPVIHIVKELQPKYVFLENVPMFLKTKIKIDSKEILIIDFIKKELGKEYKINEYIINTKDYSVPQMRERAIILMTNKKDKILKEWTLPKADKKIITMKEAIGDLPPLDPFIVDITEKELLEIFPNYKKRKEIASKISRWHFPPTHIKRQVVTMQHTPTGCSAFDNKIHFPIKEDGRPAKGYHNTYKRQNWDTPAYTITMDNRKISSQNNVHPGRLEYINSNGEEIYSDARALSIYELMIIMSLPKDWAVPNNTSEPFLRSVIGEGIPPLFVKKVFKELK